jgi:DNA-3-methyladenine glycosylase II
MSAEAGSRPTRRASGYATAARELAARDPVIARLIGVRGIGRWTIDVFLMFQLRRLDVWPVGDLGVRRGYALAWNVPTPTPRALDSLGDPYRPYRSVLAWYCWQADELYGGVADSALTRETRSRRREQQ